MIDWFALVSNSFWIRGLSIILAALSFSVWSAGESGQRLPQTLVQPAFTLWGWSGLALVTLGLALTADLSWESALWGLFTAINGTFAAIDWLKIRNQT